jgi:hypothetical protein
VNALRLIAVYGGSCAVALWLAHRFLLTLSARAAAALLLLPLVLTGRAVLEGGFYGALNIAYVTAPLHALASELPRPAGEYRNGQLSDVAIQMIPWRKAVREALKTGHAPLLNRFILSGDVLLAASQPAVFHPNVWIGFLLPLATAWTFSCSFTLFLAALCTFLFLRQIEASEIAAVFGAGVWMLSNGIVTFEGWPHSYVLSMLPLLAFGLFRLARETPGGFAATVVALVLMGFGGHPETMLLAAAGAGVLFLFELVFAHRRLLAVSRAVAAGALAAGLTAVAILPVLEALPQTSEQLTREATYAHAKKSVSPATSAASLLLAVYPRAYDEAPKALQPAAPSFFLLSYACVGGLALALALPGLMARRREKWGLVTTGLLAVLVAASFPGVTDVVTRLPLFNVAIYEYFVGVAGFCVACLAALGFDSILDEGSGPGKRLLLFMAGTVILAIGVWWRGRLVASHVPTATHDASLLLAAAPVFAFGLLAIALRSKPGVVGACGLLFLLTTRVVELPRLYYAFPARLFYPLVLEELRRLPRSDEPFRTVGLGYSMVPNQSALWELEDPRGYEAMTNRRYRETYPLWSVSQPVWFNRVDDPSSPFLAFLNVRFALGEPGAAVPAGWKDFARGEHCTLFENPAALPRAFAPERIRFVSQSDDVVEQMKSCRDFSRLAWIETASRSPGDDANGTASVRISRDGPNLKLDIAAASESWIVTSETAWKGWKAYLDGSAIPLAIANHAFLAFRVPAGKHAVRLIYWPTSFSLGLTISGVSLLVVVVAALIGLRRPTKTAKSGSMTPERVRRSSASQSIRRSPAS